MNDEAMQSAVAAWAAMRLPARLDVETTAKLLGFTDTDIHVLMARSRLIPLDNPATNAPKWFVAVEMIRLAAEQDWLHKATKEIAKYWKNKRVRNHTPAPSPRAVRLSKMPQVIDV